jgi:hypothetical protein
MRLRVLALIVFAAVSGLPRLAWTQGLPSEPKLDGGHRVATEGKWTIFRADKVERFKKHKCVGLHQDNAAVILLSDLLAVTDEGRGPIVHYNLQIDDGPPGATREAPSPWVAAILVDDFPSFLALNAKRLRVHAVTQRSTLTDDLDLSGLKAAHDVMTGPACK